MSNNQYDDQYGDQNVHDFESDVGEDFSDDLDVEDTLSDDEDWDAMEDDSASYVPPPKKKSSFSSIAIVIVVLIAGGAFMLYKFGGPAGKVPVPDIESVSSPEYVAPPPAESDLASAPSAVESSKPSSVPVQEQEVVGNSDAASSSGPLTPMPDEQGSEGTPVPSLSEGSLLPTLESLPPVSTSALPEPMTSGEGNDSLTQSAPDLLQPVSDFPSADMIKKVDPVPSDSVPPATSPETSPLASSADQGVNIEESGTSSAPASSELQGALDRIKELEAVVDKNNQLVQDYETQISSLKDTVSDLKAELGRGASSSARTSKREIPMKRTASPSVAAPVSVDRWILKGAQPGRALLAVSGSEADDVKTVSVGDTVSGLGTILSIEKGPSGWVVLGTHGQVTE